MKIKNILLQFLFFGSIFSQDVKTVINDQYDQYFQQTDEMITSYKFNYPNDINKNVIIDLDVLKTNFTIVNGLVSGPFNFWGNDNGVMMVYNVDYSNSIKNGKFFMKKETIDKENLIRIEGSFLNNLKNGVFRFWLMGSPYLVISYKNDIPDGPFMIFHKNENEYPGFSDKPKVKGIYKNGEIISYEEINKRGRVTYRSGKSREKYNKQMNDLQKSLKTLGEIFSQ